MTESRKLIELGILIELGKLRSLTYYCIIVGSKNNITICRLETLSQKVHFNYYQNLTESRKFKELGFLIESGKLKSPKSYHIVIRPKLINSVQAPGMKLRKIKIIRS